MAMTNYKLPIKPAGALRICTISDVHLGHRKTPTYAIITELEHLVVNRFAMSQLDALFITGDLFDRLLNLPFTDVGVIHQFFIKLLTLAKQFNVKVRVLEGTPSHDWKQSRLLVHINDAQFSLVFKFICC
jgi:predicted MPP superfamily phosphohydrolase